MLPFQSAIFDVFAVPPASVKEPPIRLDGKPTDGNERRWMAKVFPGEEEWTNHRQPATEQRMRSENNNKSINITD
ncbi:ABC-type transport system involved in multi-copper enzyme maturation permease component-like protein [Anopheles sinensis]|uniref:ABC-type transport system involved in multi-copper enzyme maturation permease component-like protein n=1 Tax=Anopheles sinensis TaxID=74873 RepID=A0A084WD05_ANOSI|nr:ABC-type transport system involved in multi-copper enzyme maturation permease component-like protein [Anopheles sinensis]